MLCRLIYVSRAVATIKYPDLKDILEKSQENNASDGITGILCFGNGMFLQMLEGDRQTVSRTYNRICNDSRHSDSEIVDFSEVESRLFGQWSMRVIQLGKESPPAIKALAMKYSSSSSFYPFQMNGRQCLQFLRELDELSAS